MLTMTAASFVRLLAFLLLFHAPQTEGWTPLATVSSAWKTYQTTVAALTIVSSSLSVHTSFPPAPAQILPTVVLSQKQPAEGNLLDSLKPPSDERPQIRLPSNMETIKAVDDANAPIVEALLYLSDPNLRPGPLDTIVLTVRDANRPEVALAGARLPVSRARLPTNLRLFSQNVADPKNIPLLRNADSLLVQAVVCPEGASIPCREEEQTLQARGVAKMVNSLPGLPEGVRVRAAASLPLK